MKKIFFLLICLPVSFLCSSQYQFNAIIRDLESAELLPGVTAELSKVKSTTSGKAGLVQFFDIPAGKQTIIFSFTGYETQIKTFIFPLGTTDTLEILLSKKTQELEEIIIQSTRSSRTITNTPTRVEVIDREELDEKINMRPANVSMLLHESTGLQVQQTSATSGNASIRVQGLDGRYTQLLKDGYPAYGNFASGLSVLEIPPLDLKQVEVIKGPASTLYGGGAIAGVVNFISRLPKEKPEYNFIANQSHVGQTNFGAYASHKKQKWGYTILALVNFQKAYDVDKDGFSELPKNNSITINPRLFYYPNQNTTLMLGNNFSTGITRGGDMQAITGHADSDHSYFENNNTVRNTTTFEWGQRYQHNAGLKLRSSLAFFDRKISIPDYQFSGRSTSSFTDLAYSFQEKKHILVGGANFLQDLFKQTAAVDSQYTKSLTAGVYLQDDWDLNERLKLEMGLRMDHVIFKNINFDQRRSFLLPRISALFKLSKKLSSRIGAGLGYKLPTIFTEQTETIQYRKVLPLRDVIPEQSLGGTADINYKTGFARDFALSVNQLFFYTQINHPLVLQNDSRGFQFFQNAARPVTSLGFETNVKIIFKQDLKLYTGYTFTDAKATYSSGRQFLPLLPKHKLNLSLVYEKEDNFKLGVEGYLTGAQYLYNGTKTPSFWEFGAMAQKTFGKFSLFINFENFTDQRQSRYKTVVNPPHNDPGFDDIWNHAEGFVMNGGFKVSL